MNHIEGFIWQFKKNTPTVARFGRRQQEDV
jgi:hypothetical protein